MNRQTRERAFLPLVLPLALVVSFVTVAFSLSRILLLVPSALAVIIALVITGYVLLVASLVAARPSITSRTLGVGLALGLVGIIIAGAIAGAAGMREIHAEEEPAAEGEGE